jgi:hypothetical protein
MNSHGLLVIATREYPGPSRYRLATSATPSKDDAPRKAFSSLRRFARYA